MQELTIGHYGDKARGCSSSIRLREIRTDTLRLLIDKTQSIPQCPYNKETQKNQYKNWKSSHLPVIYFTQNNRRPSSNDESVFPSGFALIDIDIPYKKFIINHPCVYATNYTKSGTHMIVHTNNYWGKTQEEWHDNYNRVAYEVVENIRDKYKETITIDQKNSEIDQGCYVWNTEWIFNDNFDPYWEQDCIWPTDSQLNNLYDKGYARPQFNTVIKKMTKNGIVKQQNPDSRECISELSRMTGISDETSDLFWSKSYLKFCEACEQKYKLMYGSDIKYSNYTTYDGITFEACETKGQIVKLYYPFFNKENPRVKEGDRTHTLYGHLLKVCQLMHPDIDCDRLLYQAVFWICYCCENSESVSRQEIINAVYSALNNYNRAECSFWIDKRKFITGSHTVDPDTGEIRQMSITEKIAFNSKARKTERILEVIRLYDPSKSVEDNIKFIQDQYIEGVSDKSYRTILNYIQTAKTVPDLVNEYKWLENIQIKAGKPVKPITILNIDTNITMSFKSVKECCKYLKINEKTFTRFKQNKTRLNKTYKVLHNQKLLPN